MHCSLADVNRGEISTFQKKACSLFGNSRVDPAHYARYAHALFGAADHQVSGSQDPFFPIQGLEFCSCRLRFDNHFSTLYPIPTNPLQSFPPSIPYTSRLSTPL